MLDSGFSNTASEIGRLRPLLTLIGGCSREFGTELVVSYCARSPHHLHQFRGGCRSPLGEHSLRSNMQYIQSPHQFFLAFQILASQRSSKFYFHSQTRPCLLHVGGSIFSSGCPVPSTTTFRTVPDRVSMLAVGCVKRL